MSAPAKRKNMATTADGAQYNKRQRPDNYAAMLAMPPPPRPSPKPAATTTTNVPPKQKVIPPHARRDKWGKWTKNGPNKAIKNELADYKKPDTAAQDTKVLEKVGEADEDVKTEATVADVTTGAEVKEEVSGADVKVDVEDYEGKHAEGKDYDTSDAEFFKDDKNKDDKVGNEGKFKDEDKHADWGTSDSEPGSPVDEPGTHFSTFTPMGQRKTIYKKERDVDGDKRPKKNNNKKFEARRNPVYGQTSAFPVLEEEENGDNVANEDDFEAMRYLKQVMNEASGLPITFSGPKPDGHGMYDAGDMRGFYEDGAYVARSAPIIGPVMPLGYKNTAASNSTDEDELREDEYMEEEIFEDEDFDIEMVDSQEEYHNRMLIRFNGFRKLMSQMPSEDKKASLSQSRWVMFPTHPPKAMRLAVRQWLRFFAEEPPHPVQVAQMDSYCVLQLLDILKRKLECFKDVEENISIWTFALLARLAEVIPIYCDDASIVREMALRALMVRVTFTGEHVPELEDKVPQYYNEDKDFFDHVDADPRQGKKQQGKEMKVKAESSSESAAVKEESVGMEDLRKALQEQKELILRKEALMKRVGDMPPWESKRVAFGLEPGDTSDSEDEEEFEPPAEQSTVPNPNANTRTTLDMILAVACDVFGQKDLSKYMEIWGEQDYERPSEEEKEELKRMEEEDSRPSLPPMLSPIGSPLR